MWPFCLIFGALEKVFGPIFQLKSVSKYKSLRFRSKKSVSAVLTSNYVEICSSPFSFSTSPGGVLLNSFPPPGRGEKTENVDSTLYDSRISSPGATPPTCNDSSEVEDNAVDNSDRVVDTRVTTTTQQPPPQAEQARQHSRGLSWFTPLYFQASNHRRQEYT